MRGGKSEWPDTEGARLELLRRALPVMSDRCALAGVIFGMTTRGVALDDICRHILYHGRLRRPESNAIFDGCEQPILDMLVASMVSQGVNYWTCCNLVAWIRDGSSMLISYFPGVYANERNRPTDR